MLNIVAYIYIVHFISVYILFSAMGEDIILDHDEILEN